MAKSYVLEIATDEEVTRLIIGHETFMYTAFPNGKGAYEIPFLINMGWSFVITVAVMIALSLAGPAVNRKAFELDKEMFRLKPTHIVLAVITVMIVAALYVKFW